MANPKVSIVIPAYNNEQYLRETLDSVLSQTYQDYEVVIADHSSIDGTAEIIESYRDHPKLRILSPTPSGGGAKANWDRVSQEARGEYLKLVCGDDLIAADALERQMEIFEKHPEVVLVAAQRDMVDAAGQTFMRGRGLQGIDGLLTGRAATKATVRSGTNIFGEPACSLFRRELLANAGWWNNRFPYLIDESTLVAICLNGKVFALRESLASFRVSASQWSVRLAKSQADQAKAFHRSLRSQDPTLLSGYDVALGNAKATVLALARRLVYFGLRRRMGREHAVESTT
ncbi:MAG: glycosyltransferase [Renibacterium salmoninarum]|nr:glycosyltransferase [Renibacterium salmoninarum]